MPPASEPPNLNSPPGAPIPNAPPSSANIAPLTTPPTTITSPETSETQSQTLQTAPSELKKSAQARQFIHYSTVGATIAIPVIALLPPRKFDLFTFGLGVTWCVSTGFVLEERTGKGLVWHVGSLIPSRGNRERKEREALEKAEAVQRARDSERGVKLSEIAREEGRRRAGPADAETTSGTMLEQLRENEEYRKREERAKAAGGKDAPRGMIKKIWMGEESDDWIEDRAKKEKEALEDGKGYGGLIGDYVREAFGFKNEEDEEDTEDEEETKKRLKEIVKEDDK